MATKAGEAYYEVYPQLNKTAMAAARRAIGEDLSNAFEESQRRMRASQKQTNDEARQQTKDLNADRKKGDRDAVITEGLVNKTRNDGITVARRAENDFANERSRNTKAQTSSLHGLATSFRTIGTITRGISAVSIVPVGFQVLVAGIGFIRATLPIIQGGLVALPGLLAAVGATAIIVKVAFKGVGTAVKDAFDPTKQKQYRQELEKLAPAARTFVTEIAKLKDIKFPNLQQAFFSGANAQGGASGLANAAKGIAQQTKGVAAAAGGDLGSVISGLTSPQSVAAIRTLFLGIQQGLDAIKPGLKVFVEGVLSLIGKDGAFGGQAGQKINTFLTKVGNGLKNLNVTAIFHAAGVAIKGFEGILGDLFGTIKNIVNAMGTNATGTGFLGGLGAIAKSLNTFTSSKPGQQFLTQLFTTLTEIAHVTDVVLGQALLGLANAFNHLQPQIKPFLDGIEKLAKNLPGVGTIIGDLASGVLLFGTYLLNFLNPPLTELVHLLGLIPKPVLMGIAAGITAIYVAFKAWSIIKGLAVDIRGLGAAIGLLDAEMDANPIGIFILALAALVVAVLLVIKYFKQISAFFHGPWGTAIAIALVAINPLLGLPLLIIGHWRGVLTGLKAILSGLVAAFNAVKGFILNTVPGWFETSKHYILVAVDSAWNGIQAAINGIKRAYEAVKNFFTITIPSWFNTSKHYVLVAVDAAWQGIQNAINGIVHAYNAVKTFFTQTIPGWFNTSKHGVLSAVDLMWNGIQNAINGIKNAFNAAKNFFLTTVPGWFSTLQHDIISAVNVLVSSIQRIWNTIVNIFAGPVKTVVNSVFAPLADAWNGFTSLLGGGHKVKKPHFNAPATGTGALPSSPTGRGIAAGGRAMGGMIPKGLGGPTQDNVYLAGKNGHPGINVSGGEYVLRADAVKQIPLGFLNALNSAGKAVSGDPSGIHIFDPTQQKYRYGGFVNSYAAGGAIPAQARARVPGVLQFLHNIAASGVPYNLGAVGPRAYDCSGLVGEVWARLTDNPSYRRYFVTQGEQAFLLSHGFAAGRDPTGFNVGLTSPPEHTVGMLGGHRFEAAHTGTTMRFDGGAANALNFAKVFHMIGMSGVGGGFGVPAALLAVSSIAKFVAKYGGYQRKANWNPATGFTPDAKLVGSAMTNDMGVASHPLISAAISAAQKAGANSGGPGQPLNLSSGQVNSYIAAASKFTNIPASWVAGLEYIISRESGGNARAYNSTPVGNGEHAQGIMQEIPSTFHAYHANGTSGSIFDPVANIASAVNYIRSRYGSVQNTPWLRHTGNFYAAGGPVLNRDHGGPIPVGYSTVYNGTGKIENMPDPNASTAHEVYVDVYVEGIKERAVVHVQDNNDRLAASLNRKTGQ